MRALIRLLSRVFTGPAVQTAKHYVCPDCKKPVLQHDRCFHKV